MQRKPRFSLVPKLHCFHHFAITMDRDAQRAEWVINPLSTSVQMQEDFIGRPSRVSRRVGVRQLHRNTLYRSLINTKRALQNSDMDTRGLDAYDL